MRACEPKNSHIENSEDLSNCRSFKSPHHNGQSRREANKEFWVKTFWGIYKRLPAPAAYLAKMKKQFWFLKKTKSKFFDSLFRSRINLCNQLFALRCGSSQCSHSSVHFFHSISSPHPHASPRLLSGIDFIKTISTATVIHHKHRKWFKLKFLTTKFVRQIER